MSQLGTKALYYRSHQRPRMTLAAVFGVSDGLLPWQLGMLADWRLFAKATS